MDSIIQNVYEAKIGEENINEIELHDNLNNLNLKDCDFEGSAGALIAFDSSPLANRNLRKHAILHDDQGKNEGDGLVN